VVGSTCCVNDLPLVRIGSSFGGASSSSTIPASANTAIAAAEFLRSFCRVVFPAPRPNLEDPFRQSVTKARIQECEEIRMK
jgi:hypothetical protein